MEQPFVQISDVIWSSHSSLLLDHGILLLPTAAIIVTLGGLDFTRLEISIAELV